MSDQTNTEERRILNELSRPFPPDELSFRPMGVKANSKGMVSCCAYISARSVIERLNETVGAGWQDSYLVLPSGEVQCQLGLKINGEWIHRADVGSQSEQSDSGDRMKAAHSDALKRAAMKFGIGLYLYRLPRMYAPFDANRKALTGRPELPLWAIPENCREAGPKLADDILALAKTVCERAGYDLEKWRGQALDRAGYAGNFPLARIERRHGARMLHDLNEWLNKLAAKPPAQQPASSTNNTQTNAPPPAPLTGGEMYTRLKSWEQHLTTQKLCVPGALMAAVIEFGASNHFPTSLDDWNREACRRGWEAAQKFAAAVQAKTKAK